MAKKRANAAKKPKQKKSKTRSYVRDGAMAALAAYDRMLTDPCAATPVPAPYIGTGSGYVVRTTENFSVTGAGTGMAPGTDCQMTFFYQWCPGAGQLTSGVVVLGQGQPVSTSVTVGAWPIAATSTVRRYRPLAACIKWIPTGPYVKRQGEVGIGYTAGQLITPGQAWSGVVMMQQSMRRASNGQEPHEARWLPTNTDGDFVSNVGLTNAQGGCVTIVCGSVDGTVNSASLATANGYIEVTTIWEWEPVSDNSSAGSTVVQAPRAPPAFTINDYLGRIRDVGAFVTRGVGIVAQAAGYTSVAQGASYVNALLTGGVKRSMTAGSPNLLTYR